MNVSEIAGGHVPMRYDIKRLLDGKYKLSGLSTSGKTSTPIPFDRSGLELYLKNSVSKPRLEEALRTLDATGHVMVEEDIES